MQNEVTIMPGATESPFRVGDVVTLRSGGLWMTVKVVHPDNTVAVMWSEDGTQRYECCHVDMLVKSGGVPS